MHARHHPITTACERANACKTRRWISGDAGGGQSLGLRERHTGRALASLTTTACKHAVSFVRRYHIPRTQRDDSIAYGWPRYHRRQCSIMNARTNGFSGESPSLSLASFINTACLHAVSFVRHYHIPRTERDSSTAYGHGIIAVNVASRTRARLQGPPTVSSGAAAGGRGGDLMERERFISVLPASRSTAPVLCDLEALARTHAMHRAHASRITHFFLPYTTTSHPLARSSPLQHTNRPRSLPTLSAAYAVTRSSRLLSTQTHARDGDPAMATPQEDDGLSGESGTGAPAHRAWYPAIRIHPRQANAQTDGLRSSPRLTLRRSPVSSRTTATLPPLATPSAVPPSSQTPIVPDFSNAWDIAYAKAEAFVAGLTLEQKVNVSMGVYREQGLCVGNIGQPSLCPALPTSPATSPLFPLTCLSTTPVPCAPTCVSPFVHASKLSLDRVRPFTHTRRLAGQPSAVPALATISGDPSGMHAPVPGTELQLGGCILGDRQRTLRVVLARRYLLRAPFHPSLCVPVISGQVARECMRLQTAIDYGWREAC
ncbi:glycoside hydrolase family 3 protein [Laetiporus sulphureus 93-53]|uniref:Glycoside hydrolase family 3 protein n=1 Tax=Laetiporus sulphureus 93-53 TaxID=1314785 RepID=A0A165DUY2_9APHY|nr:glycoside hydrolase family 3 protein [Laetiporus sulphureus 93-53]KZT05677.1 glycoside hydrolase family 3 protein [Laetiporus sulphureus 93-53]